MLVKVEGMREKSGAAETRESALASGWIVEGDETSDEAETPSTAVADDRAADFVDVLRAKGPSEFTETRPVETQPGAEQLSNAALVLLGVFGGLYLLYTWGWFIVAQAYSAVNTMTAAGSGSVGGVLQQIIFWAAPLAPALWFTCALVMSRGGRTKRLGIWLAVGAVLLMPLPMLITQGGAS